MIFVTRKIEAQWDPSSEMTRTAIPLSIVTDFGANPNDGKDDTWAFIKASKYISNEWNQNGVPLQPGSQPNIDYSTNYVILQIPAGATSADAYLVSLQHRLWDQVNSQPLPINGTNYYFEGAGPDVQAHIPYHDFFTQSNTSYNAVSGLPDPTNNYGQTYFNMYYQLDYFNTVMNWGITTTYHSTPYTVCTNIFRISNLGATTNQVNGLQIVGIATGTNARPLIKYQDDLVFGITTGKGLQVDNIPYPLPSSPQILSPVGEAFGGPLSRPQTAFYLEAINKVNFQNIEIDGNNGTTKFKGRGHDGYQGGSNGLTLFCSKVTIKDVILNHTLEDGIFIGKRDCITPLDFYGENIISNYNARDGIAYSSGKNLYIKNSSFNYTGTTPNSTNVSYGYAATLMMAGMDIEYNEDCVGTTPDFPIENGTFDNCEFNFNMGQCIINDHQGVLSHVRVNGIKFINGCTFHKLHGTPWAQANNLDDFYGILIQGLNYEFHNCHIYCPVFSVCPFGDDPYAGNPTPNTYEPTVFKGCDFEDKPNGSDHWSGGAHFFELQTGKQAIFDGCTFKATDDYRDPFYILNDPTTPSSWSIFKDCQFIYNCKGHMGYGDLLKGVKFRGNNLFKNTYSGACLLHNINIVHTNIEGSNNECNPNTLTIEGPLYIHNDGTWNIGIQSDMASDGFAKYRLKDRAWQNAEDATIAPVKIGSFSQVDVQDGSNWSHASIDLKGKFNVFNGSWLKLEKNGVLSNISAIGTNAILFLSADCNPNGYDLYQLWLDPNAACGVNYPTGNPPGSNWFGNISGVCVQGGNSTIPNLLVCPTVYQNISTSQTFTVLYNIHNVICNGGASGFVELSIQNNYGPNTPAYEYNLGSGGIALSGNTIPNLSAQSYTVTIRDAANCSTQTNSFSFTITEPSAITISSVSITDVLCYLSNNGSFTVTVNGGTSGYQCKLNSNSYQAGSTFSTLQAGLYTITVKDASNCTVTSTVTIAQPTQLTLSTGVPIILCNGGVTTITASGGGGTPSYQYNINGGVFQTTNTFSNLSAGTYTVIVKDANNCTKSTTLNISQPTTLTWLTTNFNNIPCGSTTGGSINVSAQNGTPAYQYNINGGFYSSSGNFTSLAAGNYTVNAKDANGCIISTQFYLEVPTSSGHCTCAAGIGLVATQNVILLNDPSASNLNTLFGSNITDKKFYIDGTLTIDQNISFTNCTLWFTPAGNVLLNANYEFETDQSTLQGICGDWLGITTTNAQNKVTITHSLVKDMLSGIILSDNAELYSTHSDFKNNVNKSIQFKNITSMSYPSIITNCTFSQGTTSQPIPQNGITVENCASLNIGDLSDVTKENTFTNLYNGINIYCTSNIATIISNSINQIGVFNNNFSHIHDDNYDPSNPQIMSLATATSTYTSNKGTAIFINYESAPGFNANTFVQNQNVNNLTTNPLISDCDRAVVDLSGNLDAEDLNIENCYFGIFNASMPIRDYNIIHNRIWDVHMGIAVSGSFNQYFISDNQIEVDKAGVGIDKPQPGMGKNNPPVGIFSCDYGTSNPVGDFQITLNSVQVNHIAGTGILANGSNGNLSINNNPFIGLNYASTGSTSNYFGQNPCLIGIYLENNEEIHVEDNLVKGLNNNNVNINDTRAAKGIFMDGTKHSYLNCNWIEYVREGMSAWGNNFTYPERIKFNKFDYTRHPLYTSDQNNANIGTFGTIGNASLSTGECANKFLYSNSSSWFGNGYKVFRHSTVQTFDQIITNPSFIVQSESGATVSQAAYLLATNPQSFIDPCTTSPTLFSPPAVLSQSNEGNDSISEYLDVAEDDIQYINYPDVAQWINERSLYEKLAGDELLRNSNSTLLAFYNLKKDQILGAVHVSDSALANLCNAINITNAGDLYNYALTRLDSITSGETWEMNERFANEIAIKIAMNGVGSLLEEELNTLTNLANQCPFVGGSAVYKARTLQCFYQPNAQYNDKVLCLPSSANKGISTSSMNLDSLTIAEENSAFPEHIESTIQIPREISAELVATNTDIEVYPNPAVNYVDIKHVFKVSGKFMLFTLVGDKLLEVNIQKNRKVNSIRFPHLSPGLYQYKIVLESKEQFTGKLNIEQN